MKMAISLWSRFLFLIFFSAVSLSFTQDAQATSGCCSWHSGVAYCDSNVGRYVCNDGTYSPTCGCYSAPRAPSIPNAPTLNATYTFTPNSDGKTFNVYFDWDDSPNTGYSLALHESPGGNPGPLTDTRTSNWTFYKVLPGTYYVDMKIGINGVWSKVTYWKVTVPKWYSTQPTPSPTPFVKTVIPTPTPIKTADTQTISESLVKPILFYILAIFFFYFGSIALKWFLVFAKEHDWVYPSLFWGAIIIGLFAYNLISKETEKPTKFKAAPYTCNCSKTCPNLTCAEAMYQLNECGCSARDGDGDGIPCEAQCR